MANSTVFHFDLIKEKPDIYVEIHYHVVERPLHSIRCASFGMEAVKPSYGFLDFV